MVFCFLPICYYFLFLFLCLLHSWVLADGKDNCRCKKRKYNIWPHLLLSFFDWKTLKAYQGAHHFQALARLRGLENKSYTVCCFIDHWNISDNSKLKLERVSEKDCLVVPSSQAKFRLQSSRESSLQVCNFILQF